MRFLPLSDPSSLAIVPGEEAIIEINKGGSGLGLSIVGGSDTLLGVIIIHEVYEDGAAYQDARLQSGKRLGSGIPFLRRLGANYHL